MAGSYAHIVNDNGTLRNGEGINSMLECMSGDVVEAVEEMYGMIWWLARGDKTQVKAAQFFYKEGLTMSPGVEEE